MSPKTMRPKTGAAKGGAAKAGARKTEAAALSPRERLTRGLTYSAVGPVDITRGALGLGVNSARAAATRLRQRYQRAELAGRLNKELAAAQEVVAGLPQALHTARAPKGHRRRPWVVAAVVVTGLAGGAVAFSIIRRSSRPEPSARPPSVDIEPKP
jgi:hypothetical protein